jgi:hypothetical protein
MANGVYSDVATGYMKVLGALPDLIIMGKIVPRADGNYDVAVDAMSGEGSKLVGLAAKGFARTLAYVNLGQYFGGEGTLLAIVSNAIKKTTVALTTKTLATVTAAEVEGPDGSVDGGKGQAVLNTVAKPYVESQVLPTLAAGGGALALGLTAGIASLLPWVVIGGVLYYVLKKKR